MKLDGKSKDIVSDNISKLKEIFPEVITEDKVDFKKLELILGEDIDVSSEKYSFTWPGKTQAIKESQKQFTGTLRPCREESKNWDTTQNLYIEGDNLEVLKLLQKSYYNKIKCIYIDPPYNISIVNKSNRELSFNTFDWKIEDANGAIEGPSGTAFTASDSLGSGNLAVNGKKEGSVIFEVAKDSKIKIHYQPSFWSNKKIIIEP